MPATEAPELSQQELVARMWLAAIIPMAWVVVMWLVFLADLTFDLQWHRFGILPRAAAGLPGIFFAPLLHGDLNHLINNSIPVIVLGWSLFYFYPRIALRVLVISWGLVGAWVWISARGNYHIGASGVIYSLAAFLFLSGVLRGNKKLMAISMLVTFLYGSMVWGVLPGLPKISWESHLWGAVAGALLALAFRDHGPQKEVFAWEEDEATADDGPVTIIYTSPGSEREDGKREEKADPDRTDISLRP